MPILLYVSFLLASERNWIELLPWLDMLQQTAVLLFVAAIVLAMRFNQTRIIYMVLIFILSWAIGTGVAQFEQLKFDPSLFFISQLLVLTMFSFDVNKSILGRHGLLRLSILMVIIVVNYRLSHSITLDHWLSYEFYPITDSVNVSAHFQVELLFSCLVIMLLTYRQLSKPSQINANILSLSFALVLMQFGSFGYQSQLLSYVLFGVLLLHALLSDSYQMAFSDELTGLSARRALLQSSISLGNKYTLAMLDVDHFKKFNDTYGHDVGDQVLKMVAAKLDAVKGGGKAYRYGGEEFTIIFANKDVNYAIPYLEQVRESIAHYNMSIRQDSRPEDSDEGKTQRKKKNASSETVNVTISIGVAERGGDLKEFEQVLKQADEALYRAKQAGRNCLAE